MNRDEILSGLMEKRKNRKDDPLGDVSPEDFPPALRSL
jgi:hypothetical protein